MYKAIICDLDGTLLNSEHRISEYTKNTIQNIMNKGIKIFIATGRHHKDAIAFKNLLGLKSFMITSNGAKIHDEENKEIFSHNLSKELTKKVLELEIDEDIHVSMYRDEEWLVEDELADSEDFHKESGFMYSKIKFKELKEPSATKMFYIGTDREKLAELEARVNETLKDEVNIAMSSLECLEIMSKNVSKGNAIKEVLEKEGIKLSEALAFGDGLNDLDMLSTVGKGLIMGNCNSRLKEALPKNEVIGTNDNDGVAKYLEGIFNI